MDTAVNSRMGAQALVQSNVFKNVTEPILSEDSKQVG
jgi:pectate lyase